MHSSDILCYLYNSDMKKNLLNLIRSMKRPHQSKLFTPIMEFRLFEGEMSGLSIREEK